MVLLLCNEGWKDELIHFKIVHKLYSCDISQILLYMLLFDYSILDITFRIVRTVTINLNRFF